MYSGSYECLVYMLLLQNRKEGEGGTVMHRIKERRRLLLAQLVSTKDISHGQRHIFTSSTKFTQTIRARFKRQVASTPTQPCSIFRKYQCRALLPRVWCRPIRLVTDSCNGESAARVEIERSSVSSVRILLAAHYA